MKTMSETYYGFSFSGFNTEGPSDKPVNHMCGRKRGLAHPRVSPASAHKCHSIEANCGVMHSRLGEKRRLVSLCVRNSVVFRRDALRSRFEAESWVRTIYPAVNETEWRAAVTKNVLEVGD